MACTDDTSCPGAYVCFSSVTAWNASGSAVPGVLPEGCWCTNWYGNRGPDCLEWDTPTGRYWVAVCTINAIGAFLLSALATWDVARLWNAVRHSSASSSQRKRTLAVWFDAQTTCLLQLVVGYCILGVGESLFAAQPMNPSKFDTFKGEEVASGHLAGYLCTLAGLTIAFLSCVSVAVLWLEVGTSSAHLKSTTSQNLLKFRVPMYVLEALFFLSMFVTMIAGSTAYLTFVAIGFEFIVLVTFLAGYFVLKGVLAEAAGLKSPAPALASPSNNNNNTQDTPTSGVLPGGPKRDVFVEIIRDMRRTLFLILLFLLATLAVSVSAGVLTVRGWRDEAGPPEGPVPPIVGLTRVVPTFVIGAGYSVLGFTHRSVSRRVRRLQASSSVEQGAAHSTGTTPHTAMVSPTSPHTAVVGSVTAHE